MDEIIQTLTELGLTGLQARILCALQKFEYATVKNISKSSNIHRQQIYPVLTELQKMGLIERLLDTPNRYKTVSLEQIFTILLERKANWMSEMKKKTSDLTEKYKTQVKEETKQEEYDFQLITGIEMFKQALREWGENAHTINFVLKYDQLSYQLERKLETKKIKYRKNIKVQIVTDANPETVLAFKSINKRAKYRFLKSKVPVEIAVYNNNRAHIAIFSNREDIHQTDVAALTSNHPCFVAMFQNYFETLWKKAKEKDTKKIS